MVLAKWQAPDLDDSDEDTCHVPWEPWAAVECRLNEEARQIANSNPGEGQTVYAQATLQPEPNTAEDSPLIQQEHTNVSADAPGQTTVVQQQVLDLHF